VVWQGAFVLVEYLLRSHSDGHWAGKRVVELGAGTGLCGLALARLGAHVQLTDMQHILPILRGNVATNPSGRGGSMHVSELLWGDTDAVQRLRPHECDIVLGAECVYQVGDHPRQGSSVTSTGSIRVPLCTERLFGWRRSRRSISSRCSPHSTRCCVRPVRTRGCPSACAGEERARSCSSRPKPSTWNKWRWQNSTKSIATGDIMCFASTADSPSISCNAKHPRLCFV
jgi:hypothetical protein